MEKKYAKNVPKNKTTHLMSQTRQFFCYALGLYSIAE